LPCGDIPSKEKAGVSLRLAGGSGTTLVEQMRPAHGLAMPMFAVPFSEATIGTSFGVEQIET
jgi:hypothetical protein